MLQTTYTQQEQKEKIGGSTLKWLIATSSIFDFF
jgi:hypothetical protein